MASANDRPAWGCPQWSSDEHNWHECPDCMLAYESLIEEAQEDGEEAADSAGVIAKSPLNAIVN